jgi:hypothetical protein
MIRTQQIIDAIPVLREKEYGWTEIETMLNEILIELDDTSWHTGTPTEEGWYLLKIQSDDEIVYDTNYLTPCVYGMDWRYAHDEIIKWQKIEEN